MSIARRPPRRTGVGWRRVAVYGVLLGMGCTGCASHFVNPWRDELSARDNPAVAEEGITPSVAAARAANRDPSDAHRPYTPCRVPTVADAVTHGPLYFEDRHESPAYDDGRFAWRGMDYWYMVYGPARWMANGLLMPVSVVAWPPWVLMESDGVASARAFRERHDAARAASPAAREGGTGVTGH